MKSNVFVEAISKRNKVRFNYGLTEIIIEPYYLSKDKYGKKVIYGKLNYSNEIRRFEYEKISNLKLLEFNHFSPIIPILSVYN